MSTLSEKIRKSREQWVDVGKYKFLCRRPTQFQAVQWWRLERSLFLSHCVVGWNVLENEIISSGSALVAEFDEDAFREWIEDRPELMGAVADKIVEMINAHHEKMETLEKNL